MRTLRALWHPFTPLALVLVVLPLATLLAPPDQRAPALIVVALLSPLAAIAARRALRSALDRIPVPASAPEPSYREGWLTRALRWFLVLVPVVGAFCIAMAAAGVKAWRPPSTSPDEVSSLEPYQSLFLALVPLGFTLFGLRLWRDLVSTRTRRARGLPPLPMEPASSTGDERLDQLLASPEDAPRRRGKATLRLGLVVCIASALANLLPPSMQLVASFSKGTGGQALLEFWRFATATFVHQEVVSLLVGLLAFLALAPLIEALLGGTWLTVGFIAGGFFATVSSFVFVEKNYMGMTGADAALAGLLLFFGLLQRHRLPPATARRIAVRCLAVLVIVAFAGVLLPSADTAAHLGGFTVGMILAALARPKGEVRAAMEKARAQALAAEA